MLIRPSFEEAAAFAAPGSFRVVPVSCEILSDSRTPLEVLRILQNVSGHVYLLESVSGHENWGRYTFLGYDPKFDLTCVDGVLKTGSLKIRTGDPGAFIRQVIEDYRSPAPDYLPAFTGGLVGYFSYDYLKYAEPSLKLDAGDTEGFMDVDLMLFDKVICFDNYRQKLILIVNMSLKDPALPALKAEYNKAVLELKHMADLIRNGEMADIIPGRICGEVKSRFSKEQYCGMVEKAKRYIEINYWSRGEYADVIHSSEKINEIIAEVEKDGRSAYFKRSDGVSTDDIKKYIEEIDILSEKLSAFSGIYKERYSASCQRAEWGECIIDFLTSEINLKWIPELSGFREAGVGELEAEDYRDYIKLQFGDNSVKEDTREWLKLVFENSSGSVIYIYILPIE